jgi:hypothetical protein
VNWSSELGASPAPPQNIEVQKVHGERTGGKFKIQIGYGSFGNPKELLDSLKVGSLEMTNICASYHPEKLPAFSALDLPFLPIPDLDTQEKVHLAFYKHPLIVKEFAAWNAIPTVGVLPTTIRRARQGAKTWKTSRHARAAISGIGDAMRKLGAVPTSVDATEVYVTRARHRRCGGLPEHLRTPVLPHL